MPKPRAKSEFSQLSFNEQMNHITNYLLNGNYPWPTMSEKQKHSFRCTAVMYRYDHKEMQSGMMKVCVIPSVFLTMHYL